MRDRLTCLLVALCTVMTASSEDAPAPKIACDAPQYNFGSVSDVTEIRHTFVLRNTGNADLTIQQVRPACGCTTAPLAANTVIPPGGSVDLPTTLKVSNPGEQHKSITVSSNDPQTPQYRLEINGTVARQVDVRPQQATLEITPSTPFATTEILITFNTPEPHAITGINTNSLTLCTVAMQERRPGHEYALTIATAPGLNMQTTYVTTNVTVSTDHPTHPSLNIPIILQLIREVVVLPNQLSVSTARLPAGTTLSLPIMVKTRPPAMIESIEVTAPTNGVETSVHKVLDNMYRVQVLFHDPLPELNGQSIGLHVKRQGADEELYEVPIVIVP